MARLRVRKHVLQAVAMHMIEKGKVLSANDWKVDSDAPISLGQIQNHFSSWGRMLGCIEHDLPEAWAEIQKASTPPPPPPPAPKPKASSKKKDPLAALSQAAKAEKSED